ncbi:MAG: hypothetical protein AAFY73_08880 [Pseudomonadota bacterium]
MLKTHSSEHFGHTLSRLWLFALLITIFKDLHELATAETIQGILVGTFEGNPVTDSGLVAGGIALIVLVATMVLSVELIPSAARKLNLVVPLFAFAGLFMLPPNDPDDYLLASATGATFLLILYLSWGWQTEGAAREIKEARHVR